MAALEADYDNTMSGYWHKLLVNARPETTARIEREMLSVPRDDAMAIIRAAFMYDPTELLRVYRGPVLIVDTPQRDTPGSLHRLAPHAQRRVVKQTSHWVQLDKPDEFNRLLDDFLASVR